ncbi:hypothetical protein EZ313_05490 [Ramlibacter henchirensis]|uniref:Lipoprotein n=1 Tax=Ramlibacter henchirensis TaxID=204072 RepID=A0A4Z0C7N4_9BURK|nr:hypothetical protein [Ramlibacter henchirensis]TFZ06099.1 hypothetical protein EZ313_05490 [Ramlibacter henchirensis]
MNIRRIAITAAALAAAGLLGGCAVYPAQPAYTSYPSAPVVYSSSPGVAPAPVVVAPAPVYVAPPPVYYGPAVYPSISLGIFGRFGGHRHHHRHHHRH